jgi:hypothetical protein
MLWYQLSWVYFPVLILAAWIGCLLPWWGTIDMGRKEGNWFRDFVVITFRGALWTLPMAAVFAYAGLTAVAVSLFAVGLAMGVWYEAGWRTPSTCPGFSQGSELGELYFGFAYGLTLALLAVL